jgi:hypothetical protein
VLARSSPPPGRPLTLEASVHEATWSSVVVRGGRHRGAVPGSRRRHWPGPPSRPRSRSRLRPGLGRRQRAPILVLPGHAPPFQTIQEAVDKAPAGTTIWVCPGPYKETVTVDTPRLTIKGANAGRDATTDGRHRESIVSHLDPHGTVQLQADDITWDGFTILGDAGAQNGPGMVTSKDHSGYVIRDTIFQDNGVGLDLGASGE